MRFSTREEQGYSVYISNLQFYSILLLFCPCVRSRPNLLETILILSSGPRARLGLAALHTTVSLVVVATKIVKWWTVGVAASKHKKDTRTRFFVALHEVFIYRRWVQQAVYLVLKWLMNHVYQSITYVSPVMPVAAGILRCTLEGAWKSSEIVYYCQLLK